MTGRGLFDLENHGPDTFVGEGPQYPWGGLYGGQIVAQALRAAAATVDEDLQVHSLRAYFIRRGDHNEPVRYEVDRIRNGRSFSTRRVVARQAIGAILNCEASFQRNRANVDVQFEPIPAGVPQPSDLTSDQWTPSFDRRIAPAVDDGGSVHHRAWMKVSSPLGDDDLVHCCWLAYLSDDLPTDCVVRAYRRLAGADWEPEFAASLDHTIWFHGRPRVDRWHLFDFTCSVLVGGRGLSIGNVFDIDGLHIATVAQEVLLRGSFPVTSIHQQD
ncbi:MAG TPA: thioesterase family protein [Ilumatobacteraceae bacterium]|nr:thioesterase family protein [Ilumatobacteraceae bacterium]